MGSLQLPDTESIVPVITDTAVLTGLGDAPGVVWQKLLNGQSAIRPINRFATDNYTTPVASLIETLSANNGKSLLDDLIDRLISQLLPVDPDTFLITASTKGGIDLLEKAQKGLPADTQDLLLSALTSTVSVKLGLNRTGFNISAACASGTIAVARAAAMISSGRAQAVLVCCADIITEFTFSGFSALKALSPTPCRPFDRNRQGLSLGEGAAALLLMSPEEAQRKNRASLAKVIGWGIANDATHITAPARDGCGLIHAVSKAINMSKKTADEISAVSAHGTGTIYNDLMEMTAFGQIFGQREIPIYSIKGAIGHTLAAAGGIETALGIEALKAQALPPTVGLQDPMEEAFGRVKNEPVEFSGNHFLITNSGFGGINAALILEKESA